MPTALAAALAWSLLIVSVWTQAPAPSPTSAKPTALDTRVQAFLDSRKNSWRDLNVPYEDGKTLHDLIVKNGYQHAVEIGTSTGHSGIWIAWALSKTGGKLITIEIDEGRHKQALANFKDAGLSEFIDARLGNAHDIVPTLQEPIDFVFSDADKDWYTKYLHALWPKLSPGGCFTAHNVSMRIAGISEFLDALNRLPNARTTIDRSSSSGLSITYKIREGAYVPPLVQWERLNGARPILSPQGDGFEAKGVFNPAVVKNGDRFVMLYRAQDARGISRLGYASSADGVTFTREPQPALSPDAEYERGGGVEDPRLVQINGTWYLTYTAYNGKDAQLALATSKDLRHWDRQGVIMPANTGRWNVHWTKSGAILTQPVNGKYWMYYMADARDAYDQTGVAYSTDLRTWTEALDHPVLPRRPTRFDSRVAEPGPPPVMTSDGILLLYNGADDRLVYRTGWALFDRNDPTRVLARSDRPLFEPTTAWERTGQVPNVVFTEGLVTEPQRWLVYYGAADTHVGVASVAWRP